MHTMALHVCPMAFSHANATFCETAEIQEFVRERDNDKDREREIAKPRASLREREREKETDKEKKKEVSVGKKRVQESLVGRPPKMSKRKAQEVASGKSLLELVRELSGEKRSETARGESGRKRGRRSKADLGRESLTRGLGATTRTKPGDAASSGEVSEGVSSGGSGMQGASMHAFAPKASSKAPGESPSRPSAMSRSDEFVIATHRVNTAAAADSLSEEISQRVNGCIL